jgi:predicted ATPase
MCRGIGADWGTTQRLQWQAEAHGKLGEMVEALNCLDEAAQFMERTGERFDEVESLRLRGYLLHIGGDPVAAEQAYNQALAIARRQGARVFELLAATSLARLWRDQGRCTEARDLLAPIYRWFTEGSDTPVLKEANALLDQLA